jgi:hypothetical protein
MPKTGKPDTSDVQILIGLYQAQAAHNLGEVMGYIWSNDFQTDFKEFRKSFPPGSNSTQEQGLYRALGYFETIGTLHRNNLISEDLLFDWLAVDMTWARLKGFVLGVRKEIGQSRMFENFEYMARRCANWTPPRSRPATARARPAARRRPAVARTRPAAARARPTAARRRPTAARARPTAARRRPTAARTSPTAARARPTAARARSKAARRRPTAAQTRPTAARGRSTARRTPAARKRG